MLTKEEKLTAKQAGADTGIQVIHTSCEVCMRGCGMDVYVKDGKVLRVEGTPGDPTGYGYLCQRGQAARSYVYREDRIRTPLRRTGPRGSGEFAPITWEEAYALIAEKLNTIKRESGADSVVFYTGYPKWYRPIYRRFLYSFGSKNYCTDDSNCKYSAYMANVLNAGCDSRADQRYSGVFLGWAFNRYYSGSIVETKRLEQYKRENGLKVVIVDPRITPAVVRLADLHLRPLPGTDGALAHCFANLFIQWDRIDHDYIDQHVYGFPEYAEYVRKFDVDYVSSVTTVPKEDILAAAHMLTENGPMSINEGPAAVSHHTNGLQSYRAIMALSAITGNYDRKGGQIPLKFAEPSFGGDNVLDDLFAVDTFPYHYQKKVGEQRFPLWAEIMEQGQSMDLARQIEEGTPYPIRAIFALGMNYRMFANDTHIRRAIDKLDFFVDTDLFMTDTAKLADIVLPSCSFLERATYRSYGNGKVSVTRAAIKPLYESRSDADILCELANALYLKDPLLRSGYKACCEFMLSQTGLTFDEVQAAEKQVVFPSFVNYTAGTNTKSGYATVTSKYELKSKVIERVGKGMLNPLPVWEEPAFSGDPADYPFLLVAGGRLPNAMHSRLHDVPWVRALRPLAMADLHPEDGAALGLSQGDRIEIETIVGRLQVPVNLTWQQKKGVVNLFQDYREADVNAIIPENFDPYTGFPALRSTRCRIRKAEGL